MKLLAVGQQLEKAEAALEASERARATAEAEAAQVGVLSKELQRERNLLDENRATLRELRQEGTVAWEATTGLHAREGRRHINVAFRDGGLASAQEAGTKEARRPRTSCTFVYPLARLLTNLLAHSTTHSLTHSPTHSLTHLAPHVLAALLDGLDGDSLAGDAVAAAGDDGEVAAPQHIAHLVHVLEASAAHLQATLVVGVAGCPHIRRLSYFGQVGRSRAAGLGRCAWDGPAERRQQRARSDQQQRDPEQDCVVVQPAAPVGHPAAQHI